jgi:ubiquinone biosynthesis monooxygenase Coq7
MTANPEIEIRARLKPGETLGDRILKVDHAGEHGAVNIYRGQRHASFFRAPVLRIQLIELQSHEERHRDLFWIEMQKRNVGRCRSYLLCGFGGYVLGFTTGLFGRSAIAATTYAVEHVVLAHLDHQMTVLVDNDKGAWTTIAAILSDEQSHHDDAEAALNMNGFWATVLTPMVALSTELVIWFGMNL